MMDLTKICLRHKLARDKSEKKLELEQEEIRCYFCDGYPYDIGCMDYITEEHIKKFNNLMGGKK